MIFKDLKYKESDLNKLLEIIRDINFLNDDFLREKYNIIFKIYRTSQFDEDRYIKFDLEISRK